MSPRRGVIAFVVVLLLGLAVLVFFGTRAHHSRALSLRVPNVGLAAALAPGQRACEGPIAVPQAFAAIRVWANYVGRAGTLGVSVEDAHTQRQLAHGEAAVPVIGGRLTADLNRSVARGRPVTVCLRNQVAATVNLLGSSPVDSHIHLTTAGRASPLNVALVALTAHPVSPLSELPTIFARASVFRFSWLGAWAFWLLLGGVLLAIVLGGVAVVAATGDRSDPP